MKRKLRSFICLLLAAATLLALPVVSSAAQTRFQDVPQSYWGYNAIMTAAEAGLVKGKSTNADGSMNYAPNDTMTRAEFLTTILRLFCAEEAAAAKAGAKWWTGYYDLAMAKGILKEGELENGDLDKAMTREEMALVLYRTAPTMPAYQGIAGARTSEIPDYFSVTGTYRESVLWVYGAGLIQGMDDKGTFNPQGSLTRAQSATILAKLVKNNSAAVEIPEIEETLENRQKAMVETAMAYFNKNPYMQYDWIQLARNDKYSGKRYHADPLRNTPEYASEDMTVYGVCAAWAYIVAQQTFGYRLMGSAEEAVTKNLSEISKEEAGDAFVFQHKNTGDAAADLATAMEAKAMMQPGDIVTYYRPSNSGHSVIYMGDITGDGKDDVMHINGGRYDIETGIDEKEPDGGILINHSKWPSAEEFLFGETSSEALQTMTRYSIVRPAAMDAKEYPISAQSKVRMTYPGLAIFYTTESGFYGAVQQGTEMTYTLTLKNNSSSPHVGLKATIPVPDNTVITKVDSKDFSGSTAELTLTVPANGEVTHTVTVKATGAVGSQILSGGSVQGIALPVMTTCITAYTPTAEQMKSEAALTAAQGAKTPEEFVNLFYKAATGKDARIPALQDIITAGFSLQMSGAQTYYLPYTSLSQVPEASKNLFKALVPDYYGGLNLKQNIYTSHRVLETRLDDLLPGDVVFVKRQNTNDATVEAWIFTGSSFRAFADGQVCSRNLLDMMKLHSKDFFCLVRPSQMP